MDLDRKPVKKDDFEEVKITEQQQRERVNNLYNQNTNTNPNNNNSNNNPQQNSFQFTPNDYELLYYTSQVIPIMDRLGRMLSGIFIY